MRFIDTHAHIHDGEFTRDLDEAIVRAVAAGVELIVTLGTNLESSQRAVALAERTPHVLAAAGVHPHDAAEATDADLDALEQLAQHPLVALVGEIGLDFYRNLSPKEQQLRALRRQLETARRTGKPVAVHARDAHDTMLPLLRQYAGEAGGALPDGRPLGVMHYFSGDAALARAYVDLGFVISIHTSVTHPKSETLRDVAKSIPMERMVIETDSPYGAPQAYRGKRNEPAYVVEAAKKIAEVRGVSTDAVAEATSRTALRLLRTAVPAATTSRG
jgi:TatD DNase family protein